MLLQAISPKLWGTLILMLTIAAGVMRIQRDEARIDLANYRAQVAQANEQAQAQARSKEAELRQTTDKVIHESTIQIKVAQQRAADAGRTADSLRTTLAGLNAGPTPEDTESARYAEQARAARQLLGTCADRYASVAADADQLAIQVTGLQAFARQVCGAGSVVESIK